MNSTLLKQCVAEFVGTFTLIFIGIGAIANNSPAAGVGLLGVALAHGLAIAVMVSATGAISGGQLNPAVTFGLFVGGHMNAKKSIAYWISQLAGATIAAYLCSVLIGMTKVAGGTPDIGMSATGTAVVSTGQAIIIEAVLTFFLVFVVYGSAVDARAPKIGGLAIGLTVALDILFGGPLTGAAMNPARTFGPALVSSHWNNHMVYWVGPLLGGALAGIIYGRFLIKESKVG
jgi:MIP family channel proteins